jgi:hypothetical protein
VWLKSQQAKKLLACEKLVVKEWLKKRQKWLAIFFAIFYIFV